MRRVLAVLIVIACLMSTACMGDALAVENAGNQEYLQEQFGKLLPEAAFVGEEDQEHRDRLPDG